MAIACLPFSQRTQRNGKFVQKQRHGGIAVEHCVFDRAGFTALERHFRHMHTEGAESYEHLNPDRPARVLPLTEWLLFTPCALHDSQNAFRWAVFSIVQDRDFMRTAHIGLESLHNATDLIAKHVAAWAVANIRFE